MIVVDASVAVKWVVAEVGREDALKVLDRTGEMVAPDLLLPECASVFRKKLKMGEVTSAQAEIGMAAIASAIRRFIPSAEVIKDAWWLAERLDHSVYDRLCLACALSHGRLVSADDKFIAKCRTAGFAMAVSPAQIGNPEPEEASRPAELKESTIRSVDRPSKLIRETFDHLYASEPTHQVGEFRFVDIAAVGPAFDSPAYRRLTDELAALSDDELVELVALGWLGRSYHSVADWPALLANAQSMVSENRELHARYFVAQMGNVTRGLMKLRGAENAIQSEA